MTGPLTTRPNLDHFRGQAKTLLAELRAGDRAAARAFMAHLPKARAMSAREVRAAGFRLADAQSVIARRSGFDSWSALTRHVQQLRALEGEWHFDALQIDGTDVPAGMMSRSTLLIDGDRFRMESPEATYDGRMRIDTSVTPMQIDIEFVEGPEAGQSSYGLFRLDGDALTICLGLVGAPRPTAFATRPGSGHALERLHRSSRVRPAGVTGGVAKPVTAGVTTIDATTEDPATAADAGDFSIEESPMLARLEGRWLPVRIITAGTEVLAEWLPFGSRTGAGNEATVVFGGQVMLHVKMRIDDSTMPMRVDYLNLHGPDAGRVSTGLMEWVGEDEVRFLMAAPGHERPTDFSLVEGPGLTLSHWKRDANSLTRRTGAP